jgi:hypothetical protein
VLQSFFFPIFGGGLLSQLFFLLFFVVVRRGETTDRTQRKVWFVCFGSFWGALKVFLVLVCFSLASFPVMG